VRKTHFTARYSATGFTLVELVVALGVMVVLGIMSYRALGVLIVTRDQVASEQLRWRMMTGFVQRLDLDLQQMAISVPGALEFDPVQASLRIVRFAKAAQGDDVKTVYYRFRGAYIERFEQRGFGPHSAATETGADALEQLLPEVASVEWHWPVVPVVPAQPIAWQLPPTGVNLIAPSAIKLTLRLGDPGVEVVRIFALR